MKKEFQGKTPKPVGTASGGNEYIVLPHEGELSLYHKLFEDVRTFLFERYPQAVEEAFDLFSDVNQLDSDDVDMDDSDDPLNIQFTDWLIHTPELIKENHTGIELYLNKAGRLSELEKVMLRKMDDSLVTLCEVKLIGSPCRVMFKDLLLNDEFVIHLGENIPDFPVEMLLGVRVIRFSAGPAMGLGSYPFIVGKEPMLEMIQGLFEEYKQDEPDATLEFFLKAEYPLVTFWFEYMREMVENGEGNEEAEDADMFLAHFEVFDHNGVHNRLKTISGLEEWQKDSFDWLSEQGEDGEYDFRGEVVIENGELVLSAVSEELREAGKIMLLSACGGLIRHTIDTLDTGEEDED